MKVTIKSNEGKFFEINLLLKRAFAGSKNPCGDTLTESQAKRYNQQCDFIERQAKVSSYINECEINLLHECLIMPTLIKNS